MRCALALGAALAVCCPGFDATSKQVEEPSMAALMETVKQLTKRVAEMERARLADQLRISGLEEKVASDGDAEESDKPSMMENVGEVLGQGNLLNPEITAFVDMGGSLSTEKDNDARNRFNLREVELDLRARSGATIAAIIRGEEVIAAPDAVTKILKDDTLVLVGDAAAIMSARQLIGRTT